MHLIIRKSEATNLKVQPIGYDIGYDIGYGIAYDIEYDIEYDIGNHYGYDIGYDRCQPTASADYQYVQAGPFPTGLLKSSPRFALLPYIFSQLHGL